jgi:GTP cyclohydrolase II
VFDAYEAGISMNQKAEATVTLVASARMPRGSSLYQVSVFEEAAGGLQHVALELGNIRDSNAEPVLTRLHSECITGDVFGSTRCDCGFQLREAFDLIEARQRGLLLYLRQEGRGIGLVSKLHAYNLQDHDGLDTVEANLALGYGADDRTFSIAAQMLAALGVGSLELITNNPRKVSDLRDRGVNVAKVIPSTPAVTDDNLDYLRTKRNRLGHAIPGIV